MTDEDLDRFDKLLSLRQKVANNPQYSAVARVVEERLKTMNLVASGAATLRPQPAGDGDDGTN